MKTHNVITDNCKKIRPQYQPATVRFDYIRRLQRPQLPQKHNIRIKSSARNDHRPPWHSWKMTMPLTHSCSNDGVKRHFEWRHTYVISLVQVVMAPLIFFSVALNVKMNYARNYKNLLNFVKVMPKILVVPFFSGHGVYIGAVEVQYIHHIYMNHRVLSCMQFPHNCLV